MSTITKINCDLCGKDNLWRIATLKIDWSGFKENNLNYDLCGGCYNNLITYLRNKRSLKPRGKLNDRF